MYNQMRDMLFKNYNNARIFFLNHPDMLIDIERYLTEAVNNVIVEYLDEIEHDYNEASFLNAFWANYPPDDRGRAPVGDQIPWIEVGEHSVGHKLNRLLAYTYKISEIGLPSGADNRYTIESDDIAAITNGFTNKAFLFLDVKSVGPRDNAEHIVVSPYQVSGDGIWNNPDENMVNSPMLATGARITHRFYPSISPIYAFTDGTIAPTIHLFVKPIYKMLSMTDPNRTGQPLDCIKNICLPNGLLLTENPNYLQTYPGLLFPGKDDKSKDPKKLRVRISFDILKQIADWRISIYDV